VFLVKIMAVVTLAVIIYVLLYAMQLKHIGYLVILLAGLSVAGIMIETVAPIIRDAKLKAEQVQKGVREVEERIERVQDGMDRLEKLPERMKLPEDGRYQAGQDGAVR